MMTSLWSHLWHLEEQGLQPKSITLLKNHVLEIQCSYLSPKWVQYLTPSTQQRAGSVHLVYGTKIVAAYLDQLHALFLCLSWNTLNCWLQILFSKGHSHFTTFPNLLGGYNTPVQAFWHCCIKLKSKCYIHFLCNRQWGFTLPTLMCPIHATENICLRVAPPPFQLRISSDQKPGYLLAKQWSPHCNPLHSKGTTILTITDH